MSAVEKIEKDIESLSNQEFDALAAWVDRRRNEKWDGQMAKDSAEGKLDFLFDEASSERSPGKLRDWPPRS